MKIVLLIGLILALNVFANENSDKGGDSKVIFQPAAFGMYCKDADDVGSEAWRVFNPPHLKLVGNVLSIHSNVERLKCVQLETQQETLETKFVRAHFNPGDAVVMLDWSRSVFSIPGRVSRLTNIKEGECDFEINVPLDNEFLTHNQLRKIDNGEVVTKQLSFYYGHARPETELSKPMDFIKSSGYYLLKFNVRKNTLREGLSVDTTTFEYISK